MRDLKCVIIVFKYICLNIYIYNQNCRELHIDSVHMIYIRAHNNCYSSYLVHAFVGYKFESLISSDIQYTLF